MSTRRATIIAAVAACLGFLAPAAEAATTVLKLGNVQPAGMVVQQGLQRFADLVKERTGGAVEVQIFPASQLGSEQEILEGVKLGTVHMFEGSTGAVGRFLPQLEAFAHPYVWRDTDHILKVVRGDVGQELTETLLEHAGMRTLAMARQCEHRRVAARGKPDGTR